MEITEIRTLYDYNIWANHVILQTSAKLIADTWTQPAPTSHHSLRGTLVHILGAERVWRLRCQDGVSLSSLPEGTSFPTLNALTAFWQSEEQLMLGYLAGLSSNDLFRPIHYKRTTGGTLSTPLWQILLHVVNHGAQFRGEAAMFLSSAGHSPGDIDLINFLRR